MPIPGTQSHSTRRHRLVRRQTFGQRIAAFLNPLDNLLSVSLLFETYDWEGLGETIAVPAGLVLNILLMITRANSNTSSGWRRSDPIEEVLRDPNEDYGRSGGSGAIGWFMHITSILFFMFSVANTIYTLNRTRQYRTFETSPHSEPPTPSARRVRVASSPNESSPARFVKSLFPNMPYASTPPIHDGITEDEVWEIAKWDYTKFNLAMSTYFSPIHCLVIFLLLPYIPPPSGGLFDVPTTAYSTSRMTVLRDITFVNVAVTMYLYLFFKAFQTQNKDDKYINSQVFGEYNKKYVDPRVHVTMRDCGTSMDKGGYATSSPAEFRPGFKTHVNPAYERHTVPQGAGGLFAGYMKEQQQQQSSSSSSSSMSTGSGLSGLRQETRHAPVSRHDNGIPAVSSRQSFGVPSAAGSAIPRSTTTAGRKSLAAGELMTPARRVASGVAGMGTPGSNAKPGKNGNVWGGGVDYGIRSPMRRTTRDRGI
ncbi:hypothetical protein H072_10589 [Dactylellina haptotyla CBS 200.50]|uniref:Nuclear rim protein 1 n=1 Tax=Dactylellina haptotyla (strain CBS 200.50) TaxID=1284197 RepID=S8BA19_DACHA|nr:hypothetical protein H072_10589 [Dactylellina haptotyla CBS 200.50]